MIQLDQIRGESVGMDQSLTGIVHSTEAEFKIDYVTGQKNILEV
jgi:hypothetical protein